MNQVALKKRYAEEDDSRSVVVEWLDKYFPWLASALVHLAILIIVVFAIEVISTAVQQAPDVIIIPQGFNQPFTLHPENPNAAIRNNPIEALRQNLQQVASSGNAAAVSKLLNNSTPQAMDLIAHGPPDITAPAGALTAYGMAGGGIGQGPPSNFFGMGGNATRIVYVIDHSGSMYENFDFLQSEILRSIGNLVPLQNFAVIVFNSNGYDILQPASDGTLVPATNPNKNIMDNELPKVAPEGIPTSGLLDPFVGPFQAAFQMHPQIIYFVTNGSFDPQLITDIGQWNKQHKAFIFTYAFMQHDPVYEKQLKEIADQNGGQYEYISQEEAGD
jgi:hypothetical protein